MDADTPKFELEQRDAFSTTVNTEAGYRYSVDPVSAGVAFNHRVRARPSSAGPPILEIISEPAPYTKLLENVLERLLELSSFLPVINGRGLRRIGIVSQTTVQLEDAPPGIGTLFDEIGRPLGGTVDSFNVAITNTINKADSFIDRCIHTLTLPEDDKQLVTIQLDWQRTYLEEKVVSGTILKGLLESAKSDALNYYERVAEGGLSDGNNSGS